MAFTATKNRLTVHGDERVWHGVVSADNSSGSVSLGFDTIYNAQMTPKSMTTLTGQIAINALPEGTASVGTLAFSGTTSGDDMYVTVWGR